MTRRERLERKVERRREWAEKRRECAAAQLSSRPELRADHAFNTQPGHIPERARMIRADDRAFESLAVAQHHQEKADGLERQLERTIFSDDPDAVEQLEARATQITAKADRMTAANRAYRKAKGAAGWSRPVWPDADWVDLSAYEEKTERRIAAAYSWEKVPFPPYSITNLRANARRLLERAKAVRAQQGRAKAAEDAGGVAVLAVPGTDWVRVTFAEKPARAILAALRSAGFRWGGGSWHGNISGLPEVYPGNDGRGLQEWEAMHKAIAEALQELTTRELGGAQ